MSDLTNTPRREPAYGPAAERYSKEQRLGAALMHAIQECSYGKSIHAPASETGYDTDSIGREALRCARSLGLLDAPRPTGSAPAPYPVTLSDEQVAERGGA